MESVIRELLGWLLYGGLVVQVGLIAVAVLLGVIVAGFVIRVIVAIRLWPEEGSRRSAWIRFFEPGSVPLALMLAAIEVGLIAARTYDVDTPEFVVFVIVAAAVFSGIVVGARHLPVFAYVLAAAAVLVATAAVYRIGLPSAIVVPVVAYCVAAWGMARRYDWTLGTALLLAAVPPVVSAVIVDGSYRYQNEQIFLTLTFTTLLGAAVVVTGHNIRRRRQTTGELVEVRQEATEQRGKALLLAERARIAREMHDVVAHHMSVIAVQASTAEFRHDGMADSLREEFRSIADSAREALTEMRRLLGVFRQDGQVSERMPQPGVEGIRDLAESARRTGIEVTVSMPDELPELPDTVSLTAYRIVQEGLSNVVRHASGAKARVELYLEGEWLAVLVMNNSPLQQDGANAQERKTTETMGLGIAGMRERVALVGGEIMAERLGTSGFVVKARLPLTLEDDR